VGKIVKSEVLFLNENVWQNLSG